MTAPRYKSKTWATWIALVTGSLGLHRFYLYGPKDVWAWLHPWPTLLGAYGAWRVIRFGQDDPLSWALIPLLGLMLASTMLMAIIYGLTPDERWNARFNPDGQTHRTGWTAILGVVLALMVGAAVLMATLAYGFQRYFEYQIEEARRISQ